MRYFIILSVVLALSVAGPIEEISFEELDIKDLLGDEAKSKAAFECLMDRAPCGDLQKLRDTVPEMVQTKCSRCTPKQQEKYNQVTKLLFETHPKEFQALAEKYSSKSD